MSKIVLTSNGQTRVYTGKYKVVVPHAEKKFSSISCTVCGDDFKKTSGSAKYCPFCKRIGLRTKFGAIAAPGVGKGGATKPGVENPNYRHGGKTYQKSRKDRCEKCGASREARVLDVHHKDHNHYNNDPNNWVTLCRSCHMQEHRK